MIDNLAVCLSGGIDSTTVLGLALRWPVNRAVAISFEYGSKHNELELLAAKQIAESFGVPHVIINVKEVFKTFNSSLLNPDVSVPEGHYSDASMASTVVPMRNVIFASIAAGYAINYFGEDRPIRLGLGVHRGDHAIYPDCRPETIFPMMDCFSGASAEQVHIFTPLLNANKAEIVQMGLAINAPYSLTRTCYNSELAACGKCGSCHERLEAFSLSGVKDPVIYEGNYGS